jgi:hypothetical protein
MRCLAAEILQDIVFELKGWDRPAEGEALHFPTVLATWESTRGGFHSSARASSCMSKDYVTHPDTVAATRSKMKTSKEKWLPRANWEESDFTIIPAPPQKLLLFKQRNVLSRISSDAELPLFVADMSGAFKRFLAEHGNGSRPTMDELNEMFDQFLKFIHSKNESCGSFLRKLAVHWTSVHPALVPISHLFFGSDGGFVPMLERPSSALKMQELERLFELSFGPHADKSLEFWAPSQGVIHKYNVCKLDTQGKPWILLTSHEKLQVFLTSLNSTSSAGPEDTKELSIIKLLAGMNGSMIGSLGNESPFYLRTRFVTRLVNGEMVPIQQYGFSLCKFQLGSKPDRCLFEHFHSSEVELQDEDGTRMISSVDEAIYFTENELQNGSFKLGQSPDDTSESSVSSMDRGAPG